MCNAISTGGRGGRPEERTGREGLEWTFQTQPCIAKVIWVDDSCNKAVYMRE